MTSTTGSLVSTGDHAGVERAATVGSSMVGGTSAAGRVVGSGTAGCGSADRGSGAPRPRRRGAIGAASDVTGSGTSVGSGVGARSLVPVGRSGRVAGGAGV